MSSRAPRRKALFKRVQVSRCDVEVFRELDIANAVLIVSVEGEANIVCPQICHLSIVVVASATLGCPLAPPCGNRAAVFSLGDKSAIQKFPVDNFSANAKGLCYSSGCFTVCGPACDGCRK